jgi:hypothetical protein
MVDAPAQERNRTTFRMKWVPQNMLVRVQRGHPIFFVLCFVYLWLAVGPHLIYHGFGTLLPDAPPFATGWPFLQDSLGRPGGPVFYVSGFLSQGYYYPWLGAAIIVLAGFCLAELCLRHLQNARHASAGCEACCVAGASTRGVEGLRCVADILSARVEGLRPSPRRRDARDTTSRGADPRSTIPAGPARSLIWLLAPLPALMLFLLYSQYNHPLPLGLAVALGLLLSLLFERLPLRQPLARMAGCSLIAVAGFWLGGAGTWLLFALMTMIHGEGSGRVRTTHHSTVARVKRWCVVRTLRLLPLLASAGIAWALVEYLFLISAREAALILTPWAPSATKGLAPFLKVLVFLLYGFVPLAVLLVWAGRRVFGGPDAHSKRTGRVRTTHHSGKSQNGAWYAPYARPALSLIPIALMALGLYVSHKELRKPYVLSNYYSRQRQWDKIIELAHRLPKGRSNPFVSHDIVRALYHTGRLPYDMFCHALIPEAILLTHEKGQSDLTQGKLSDIFLELGHINMAQKLASELLTTKGHCGVALEELGWIGLIKGQPGTARVYWEALTRDLVYHRKAQALLHGLDHGLAPEQAVHVSTIRSYLRPEKAGVTGGEPVDETLAALLAHNPRNKMAFEYLMACYLVTGRVDKIAENVNRLRDLGYPTIPTLYEEALLIHYGSTGQTLHLTEYTLNPETVARYETFVRIAGALSPQNRQAVLNQLIRDYGTSYFFYCTFGRVGLM